MRNTLFKPTKQYSTEPPATQESRPGVNQLESLPLGVLDSLLKMISLNDNNPSQTLKAIGSLSFALRESIYGYATQGNPRQKARALLSAHCTTQKDFENAEIALAVYQTLLNFFGEFEEEAPSNKNPFYNHLLAFEIFQHINQQNNKLKYNINILNVTRPFCTPEQQARIKVALTALWQKKPGEELENPDGYLFSYLNVEGIQSIDLADWDILTSEQCQLTSLRLNFNGIRDNGATALANALQSQNCQLTSLALNHNGIGDNGATALANALQSQNCQLTSLALNGSRIRENGATAVANALQSQNCQLTSLALNYKSIGDNGATALANALQSQNCQLTSLALNGSRIGENGATALANALQSQNCQLTSLTLDGNDIGENGATALAKAQIWAALDGRPVIIRGIEDFNELKEALRETTTAAWQQAHPTEHTDAEEVADNENAQNDGAGVRV